MTQQTPTLIYPVGENRDDMLRWSLRSLQLLDDWPDVWLIGHRPDWVDPATVHHVATVQDGGPFQNVAKAIAFLAADGPDGWVWMQDDIYLLEPITMTTVYARINSLDQYCDALNPGPTGQYLHDYVTGVRRQRDLLRSWGYDTSVLHNGCCHFPLPMTRVRLEKLAAQMASDAPDLEVSHFKALYAADLTVTRRKDSKLLRGHVEIPNGWPVLSTSSTSWKGRAGREIRFRYPTPSPYER